MSSLKNYKTLSVRDLLFLDEGMKMLFEMKLHKDIQETYEKKYQDILDKIDKELSNLSIFELMNFFRDDLELLPEPAQKMLKRLIDWLDVKED